MQQAFASPPELRGQDSGGKRPPQPEAEVADPEVGGVPEVERRAEDVWSGFPGEELTLSRNPIAQLRALPPNTFFIDPTQSHIDPTESQCYQ